MTCPGVYRKFYFKPAEILLTLLTLHHLWRPSFLEVNFLLVFTSSDVGDSWSPLWSIGSVYALIHPFILQTSECLLSVRHEIATGRQWWMRHSPGFPGSHLCLEADKRQAPYNLSRAQIRKWEHSGATYNPMKPTYTPPHATYSCHFFTDPPRLSILWALRSFTMTL